MKNSFQLEFFPFPKDKSSQLETQHCQNLDTKCPGQATIVLEKEAGVVEGNSAEHMQEGDGSKHSSPCDGTGLLGQ